MKPQHRPGDRHLLDWGPSDFAAWCISWPFILNTAICIFGKILIKTVVISQRWILSLLEVLK